jgi:hypothetical protein
VILLGILSWFIYNDYFKKDNNKNIIAKNTVQKIKNQEEQKLADSINKTGTKEIYLTPLFNQAQPIIISDSIIIEKDSLHVHGGGLTLIADSAYKSTALVLSSNCKYILIDSLVLENFDIGIIARNTALHLKDVQFKNCGVAVQHEIILPGSKNIRGKITDSLFSISDSIKIKH